MNKKFNLITFLAVAGLSYFQENLYGSSVFYDPDKINKVYVLNLQNIDDDYAKAFEETYEDLKKAWLADEESVKEISKEGFRFNFLDGLIEGKLRNIGNNNFRQVFRNVLTSHLFKETDFIFDEIIAIKNKDVKNTAVDIFRKNISELFRQTDWVTNEDFGEHFRDIVVKHFDGVFFDDFLKIKVNFLDQMKRSTKQDKKATILLPYSTLRKSIANVFSLGLIDKNIKTVALMKQRFYLKIVTPIDKLFNKIVENYNNAIDGEAVFNENYKQYYKGYDCRRDLDAMQASAAYLSDFIDPIDNKIEILQAKIHCPLPDIHDYRGQDIYNANLLELQQTVQSNYPAIDPLREKRDTLLKNIDFLNKNT